MTADGSVVVGVMSGTSLDGVSAAVARFIPSAAAGADEPDVRAELVACAHRPFSAAERDRLLAAMQGGTARDYCRLHVDLGGWLAEAALAAIVESGVPRRDILAVASHGQTLWHEPGHSTWQAGDAATIAERTGCAVVADFRARDVAVGGQGAPLVPMADARLFAHPTRWRALQNLGGIGNVTVVPPLGDGAGRWPLATRLAAVRAFDTGPGVVLMDAVVRHLFAPQTYDVDGRIARGGRPVETVVRRFLDTPWFAAPPPKSTGREWFTEALAGAFVADVLATGATEADVVATAVACTARSIADQYARFVPEPVGELLLSGGGARNPVLVEAIRAAVSDAWRARGAMAPPVVAPFDATYFDAEAKEAVAFAFLGYLHLMGRAGNVPAATGAHAARVLGAFTPTAPS